jgi:hypothetical protein
VWTAQGVVPTLSDAEPPPKAPKPPRAKNK